MPSAGSFLRQLGNKETWAPNSKRHHSSSTMREGALRQMGGLNFTTNNNMKRKRVMVLVDESSHAKHAMMFALTHVANKGDLLTLLHVVPLSDTSAYSPYLANSLGSLGKACRPQVEVEALVIQGPKFGTVMSQVKKLEVSVLILGQKKPSSFLSCICGTSSSTEEFVEQCIYNSECLTIGVRKQSNGLGGYLISTRWQKNFWLLA